MQVVWSLYEKEMAAMQFDASASLYVASGIFNSNNHGTSSRYVHLLQKYGKPIICRGDLLTLKETFGLFPEQLAAIDFMVLKSAHKMVGFGISTFSTCLQEYRCMSGLPTRLIAFPMFSRDNMLLKRSRFAANRCRRTL